MKQETITKLEAFRQLHNELLEELDALTIKCDETLHPECVEVLLRERDFFMNFQEYETCLRHSNMYPYEVSATIDNVRFHTLVKTLPQKEKPLLGAEVK